MNYNPYSEQDDIMRLIIDSANSDNRPYVDIIYTAAAGLRSIKHAPDIGVADAQAIKTLDVMFRKLMELKCST